MTAEYHKPVLRKESVDALNIRQDGIYVDVTFGGGGHSEEILGRLGKNGRLIAFDQDADASVNIPDDTRFVLVRHNFRYLKNFLRYYDVLPVNGILADLGVSSHQFDEAKRGFSLRFDSPMDMRMNATTGITAAGILNTYPEVELVRIFSSYGEVFNAKTLSRKICETRKDHPFDTTGSFLKFLTSCSDKYRDTQYMAKVFQALRIEVNDELGSLKEFLLQSPGVMDTGGRLVVISYHSLEDRLVKNFIAKGKFEGSGEKDFYGNPVQVPFRAIHKKPVEAGDNEIAENPRARSAKLRVAERI